ncbi:MAG: ATP-binding protein [Deltaproteobacteria bacterium]|nr:ATP-binding protein [Deltaproteobacteria bacterium]MDQ3301261.1 AAA family ATPase [Myxococcota bacterium]
MSEELFERVRFREAVATDPPAFVRVLGLTDCEALALILLAALEIDAQMPTTIRALSPAGMTIGAIRTLVYGDAKTSQAFTELGASGALRRLRLIERSDGDDSGTHVMRQTWTVAPRVLGMLHENHSIDPEVSAICHLGLAPAGELEVAAGTAREARTAMKSRSCIVVTGIPGLGRRGMLVKEAGLEGLSVISIDSKRLAKEASRLTSQLRAIARECKLLGRVPLICNIDALVDDKEDRIALVGSELVALIEGPVLVTCGVQRPKLDWGRPVIVIEMGQPTSAQRAKLWQASLGQGTAEDAELLATQYPLAPALIVRASEAAKARAQGRKLEPEDIYAGIRAVLDDRLGQLAKRVTVTQTWDDLVLPQDQADSIVELMARIRERRRVYEDWGFAAKVGKGLGVSALFSGPPGTGKTMVAALIARDLGLELYQVDVSKVVSKFIGETEQNLAALFDAAEAGHAILLFDEADALFGKRTDVKSSNDRYANLETNYLLQRLESFTGICLLTSNHESHIDPAFQRRLSLHLRFDLPDAEQRADLWKAMLPAAAPVTADIDVTALGRRYAMSGGYIRNAALRAAFLAANEGNPIGAVHLERAARLEYEGMGKIAAN